MLAQPVVRYVRHIPTMDDIGRKTRRQGTLEEVAMDPIPEDLVENPLIEAGVKAVVSVQRAD